MDQNELNMHPKPKDPSVLHLQGDHRSSLVWEVGGGDNQRSRHHDPNNIKFPPLHPRMVPVLRSLRFDGVSRVSRIQIDWSLITALIERWRSETHTFHLPFGECMISLQDVGILLGLQIDGPAVTGFTAVEGGWGNYIERVLGVKPDKESLVGGRVRCSWLNKVFPTLPDNASDLQLQRYTQSYLLQLIGGVLFTDHSGGQVHCMYIPLIKDLESCGKLSWGSAVLAFLYRELCKSCKKDKEENAGCIILLQLWAWSRLPTLAPIPRGPPLNNALVWGDLPGPYGLRWCAGLSFTDSGSHTLAHSRLSLDVMVDSQFTWTPYTDEILAALPDYCKKGSSIWRYKGSLICFCIVEPHHPDRCLRQFGMIQSIPSPCHFSPDLHKIDLKGKTDIDWAFMHRDHLHHWNSREEHVFVGDIGAGVSDNYHQWYSSITLPYLTRIGGGHSYTMDLLDLIDSVYKGETCGDLLAITAHARHVLQEKFSLGYYQDFPIEDRRAKEVELKGKTRRVGQRGGRGGVNVPRRRGTLPNLLVDDEIDVYLAEDGGVHLGDEGGFHLNDERGIHISDKSTHIQEHEDERRDVEGRVIDPMERSFLPKWDLIPSNDSLLLSPPHKQTDVDQTPPLSHPTFYLFTQSPPRPVQQTAKQSGQHLAEQLTLQFQQATEQQPAEQQQPTLHDEQQHQQPALQDEQHQPQLHMKLRTRKKATRPCGTDSKNELETYKRRKK